MPFALILALAASLGIHLAVLFGPEVELSTDVESPVLMAELKPSLLPVPRLPAKVEAATRSAAPKSLKPARVARRRVEPVVSASPVLSVPDGSPLAVPQNGPQNGPLPGAPGPALPVEPEPEPPAAMAAEPDAPPAVPRLPPHGVIRYRVDRGDSNFEIGFAQHEWFVVDGHYRLTSVAETTGLVWLFKSIRVEMESRGLVNAEGLQPQTFAVRRNGRPTRESADFDWERRTVRVADRAEQSLDEGAQDFLSFNYQLGYLAHPEAGTALHIATGKKYESYHLEALGDETIELPAGSMRTLHLRTAGKNSTELWLAYDYLLLPVKIRYVDAKGDSFVQLATRIQVGDELDQNDARPR